jgi:ABC-type transporter Mla subunit MlaD
VRQIHKHLRRLTAGMLSLCLLAGCLAPCALAADGVIHIRSAEDWQQLVRDCRLDTWSQGKTVVLDCDLDLTGETEIPTFGGTFNGQGHTIRGWRLEATGSHFGLFRYVQEGAVVKNLNVSGAVSASGSGKGFGGIAGVNRGTIAQCSFSGVVDAPDRTGGIAGINEAAGEIINCSVSGVISGEHFTGGVAGENYGSVIQCTNQASVNTRSGEISPELDDIDWSKLNSTENIPACTDTGGIVGYSKGVLRGCVNFGAVGYPHTGYNVGGIAGRQAGYVTGCTNHGTIQGRKEVGGIIGQMEPYTQLRFQKDTLQRLGDELSVLWGLMEDALDHTDQSRKQLSGHLTAIGDLTDSARGDVSGLLEDLEELGDDTIDTVNDLSARISRVLDDAVPVVENLEDGTDELDTALSHLEKTVEALEDAGGPGSEALHAFSKAMEVLRQANGQIRTAAADVVRALELLRASVGLEEETKAAMAQLASALLKLGKALGTTAGAVGDLMDALGGLEQLPDWDWDDEQVQAELAQVREALAAMAEILNDDVQSAITLLKDALAGEHMQDRETLKKAWKMLGEAVGKLFQSGKSFGDALRYLRDAGESLAEALGEAGDGSKSFKKALSAMADSAALITDALGDLKDLLEEQADEPTLEFPKLDSAFHEKEDSLSATFDQLSQELRSMHSTVDTAGDTLSGSLRRVNNQFSVISNLLRDSGEEDQDRVVDTSEEDDSITMGTVADCGNRGTVEGDVNTGGVTGSMAVELDFDPEDDISQEGDLSADFQYLTHAVLRDSVNHGAVTGRKDCVGSVVGKAEVGAVLGCEGYGSAESTSGSYVGGIAGRTSVPLRNCWAKCDLTGESHVGGIAGSAEDLTGCRALVRIEQVPYSGAIAGEAQGTLKNNCFVSEELGGVDGISYSGQAEPVDYQTLVTPEAPREFSVFSLTFMAEDRIVKEIPFVYGHGISEEEIPAVPEKEGFYGAWEEFDRTALTFDENIEAVYTPWVTTLSDESGLILAEGTFAPDAALLVSAADGEGPAGKEMLLHRMVRMNGNAGFTALRVRQPDDAGKAELWYRTEGGSWQRLPETQEGRYLRVELVADAAEICLVKAESAAGVWGIAALAAVAGLAVLILKKRRKKTCNRKTEGVQ